MSNKKCVVIFPIYKSLDDLERLFLEQAVRLTDGFEHVFILPEGMLLDSSFGSLACIAKEYFDSKYFESIASYNSLMLAEAFYERFADYEYMLIHQSDAYLFHPELEYWCGKGYDYIGAPWINPPKKKKIEFNKFILKNLFFLNFSETRKKRYGIFYAVGNGGLSLRKVDTCISILKRHEAKSVLNTYVRGFSNGDTQYNEDVFWAIEAPRIMKEFRTPTWQEALHFSVEGFPEYAYQFNNNKLPFGCHASLVYETDFWKEYIPEIRDTK